MVFYFDFRKITSMVRRGMQELWTRTTDVRQKLSPHTETQSESLFHNFLNRHGTSHLKLYKFLIPTLWRLSSLGHNTNGSRMCGILLYVEEVGTLWPLCAAESIWKEKIQQLSWRNVSSRGCLAASACVLFFLLSFEKWGEKCFHFQIHLRLNISLCSVTWWTGWWMRQRDWQWTVPPLCVQGQGEEEGWRPPQTNSSACSTPSLPVTSQVSNGIRFCSCG